MKNIFNVNRICIIFFLSLFTWLILPQILGQLLINVEIPKELHQYKLLGFDILEYKKNVFSSGYTNIQLNFSNHIFVVISIIYTSLFYLNDIRFKKRT